MTIPFVLACLWCIAANFAAMVPSRRSHWPAAFVLLASGIPILIWLYFENGPWFALIFLAAGVSMLRWPVLYLVRWLKRIGGHTD